MKKTIGAALVIATLLIGLWYYQGHNTRKPFRCDTQQISVQVKTQNPIVLNANSTVIFSSAETGIAYITGSITENGTRYLLDRNISFTITPSELKGSNNTQFTHEEVHPADNTPDNVWRNVLMPEVENVDFYTKITPLLHNALLIQGVTNPFLACVMQD